MYTLKEITQICKDTCEKENVEFNIPVILNARFTTTLGRVKYTISQTNGRIVSTSLELSKKLVEEASDEEVKQVILHECAHHIVTTQLGRKNGHGRKFKECCARIGCYEDKPANDSQYLTKREYKYEVYCEDCKRVIARYFRKGNTLKNIDHCLCATCKGNHLTVIQNW